MAAIHIREISPEFLHSLKLAATVEGKTLKAFVLASLDRACKDSLQKGRENMEQNTRRVLTGKPGRPKESI